MDKTVIKISKLDEVRSDFAYRQTRPYEERLAALESIRNEYIKRAYDIQAGFQRVYRVNFIDISNLKKNKKATGRLQDPADLENMQ